MRGKLEISLLKTLRDDSIVMEEHLLDQYGQYLLTTEIIFRDNNGNEIRFSRLIPEGWNFVSFEENKKKESKSEVTVISKQSKFHANPQTRTISYGDLRKSGSLFGLLHERRYRKTWRKSG